MCGQKSDCDKCADDEKEWKIELVMDVPRYLTDSGVEALERPGCLETIDQQHRHHV